MEKRMSVLSREADAAAMMYSLHLETAPYPKVQNQCRASGQCLELVRQQQKRDFYEGRISDESREIYASWKKGNNTIRIQVQCRKLFQVKNSRVQNYTHLNIHILRNYILRMHFSTPNHNTADVSKCLR